MLQTWALIIMLHNTPVIAMTHNNSDTCENSALLYIQRYATDNTMHHVCVPIVADQWLLREGHNPVNPLIPQRRQRR